MGAFRDGLRQYSAKVEAHSAEIFERIGEEVLRSIQSGSELTGAPGQPVDTGKLRDSWQRWYESPAIQVIATGGIPYAPVIEDGVIVRGKRAGQPLTLRSQVGGFHSVALTIAGLPNIVEAVTAEVVGRG